MHAYACDLLMCILVRSPGFYLILVVGYHRCGSIESMCERGARWRTVGGPTSPGTCESMCLVSTYMSCSGVKDPVMSRVVRWCDN